MKPTLIEVEAFTDEFLAHAECTRDDLRGGGSYRSLAPVYAWLYALSERYKDGGCVAHAAQISGVEYNATKYRMVKARKYAESGQTNIKDKEAREYVELFIEKSKSFLETRYERI